MPEAYGSNATPDHGTNPRVEVPDDDELRRLAGFRDRSIQDDALEGPGTEDQEVADR